MNRFQEVRLALSSENNSTKNEKFSADDRDGSNLKTEQSSNRTKKARDANKDDATVKTRVSAIV